MKGNKATAEFDPSNPADIQRMRAALARDGGTPMGHAALGAMLYLSGDLDNMKASIPHLEIGVGIDDPIATGCLGDAYYNGFVVERNVCMAVELFERAGYMGHAESAFSAANEYLLGSNINADYEKAFELFTIAADANLAKGFNGLGILYMCGFHVGRDLKRAKRYFRMASARGSDSGARNLKNIEELGEDYDYAEMFYGNNITVR